MASCEQLAGELKVLEEQLKHYSTEHKRREIIDKSIRSKRNSKNGAV